MAVINLLSFQTRVATLVGLFWITLFSIAGAAADAPRTTFFVSIPSRGSWQDMAFLAAVPTATFINGGAPSLIALNESGEITPEILDYAKRYRPSRTILLGGDDGNTKLLGKAFERIKAVSADEAACQLSRKFWVTSNGAVLCPEDDYEAGLVASALAARLRVPLLFTSKNHVSTACVTEILRLKLQNVVAVGQCSGGVQYLRKEKINVTELAGGLEVMAWVKQSKIPVDYLAVVHPQDRENKAICKLSLAGALLAAGRGGLVAPLTMPCHWRTPFGAFAMESKIPANIPKTECPPRSGTISLSGAKVAFILTEKLEHKEPKVYADLNGDGNYSLGKEGPFVTGDTVKIGKKNHIITLDSEFGLRVVGKSDIRLSGPPVFEVIDKLHQYYLALGSVPEYLCLVGFPDTIPQEITGKLYGVLDLISDLPYSDADDDPFAEISVARLIAEDVSFGSLFVSRVLTYSSLLAPDWSGFACQAQWENSFGELFGNAGYNAKFHHTAKDLEWIERPAADGSGGKRKNTIEQASPVTHCSILSHNEHSGWNELGGTYHMDSHVLLAPTVVESGGCSVAAIDGPENIKSVITRLFRNGAVSFVGNGRNGRAQGQVQRMEFWANVLDGKSVGQAHRKSINSMLMTVLNQEQDLGKNYLYQVRGWTLFGDPAFRPQIPQKAKTIPAHLVVTNDIVTVFAPATWWPVKIVVPADWTKWKGKDLFALRGAGSYSKCGWGIRERNEDQNCYTAEFTTKREVADIKQLGGPPAPLGMLGKWKVDRNANGTSTYRWVVRLADFDQETGRIIEKRDRFDYQIVFQ